MDKIIFKGMTFYGYHGVFPEENKLGQTYEVTLEVYMDLQQAGKTDDLKHTLNYAELFELSRSIVEEETYQLIETIAENIASRALTKWSLIQEIVVKVTKPTPPIPGNYDAVAVEISRRRQ